MCHKKIYLFPGTLRAKSCVSIADTLSYALLLIQPETTMIQQLAQPKIITATATNTTRLCHHQIHDHTWFVHPCSRATHYCTPVDGAAYDVTPNNGAAWSCPWWCPFQWNCLQWRCQWCSDKSFSGWTLKLGTRQKLSRWLGFIFMSHIHDLIWGLQTVCPHAFTM